MAIGLGTVLVIAAATTYLFYYFVKSEREREQDRQEERWRLLEERRREALRAQQGREYAERNRAAVQVFDTNRLREDQARQNQLSDNRSFFRPPFPIPHVELDSYIQNARGQQQRLRRANSRIWHHWQIVIDGLSPSRYRETATHAIYLDIATLEACYGSSDKSVIYVLISKAEERGLNQISDSYLRPLMYRRKSANEANARYEDYSPLTSETLTTFHVKMETLSNKRYTVRSFFGAVHAILYYSLPPSRSLREYIEILTHFTKPLARVLRPYLSTQTESFRAKISLLVSLSSVNPRDSGAIIGFNAVGKKQLKARIVKDRMEHLSVLEDVQSNGLRWQVGNCAEDESFRHLPELCSSSTGQSRELIAATLTLDILDGEPNGPCKQCVELSKILRRELRTTILSLAPVKRNGTDQNIGALR